MLVDNELNNLSSIIIKSLADNGNHIAEDITDYLTSKSKKLRPAFVFLFSKALNIDITDKIYSLACAVELVHNSTLVHDDILDNAETRRGKISLNFKLGNSLSVLAGDILLAAALQQLVKCQNIDAVNAFAKCLYTMCKGEINQNFTIGKLPSFDEYIKKSEYKTAELFKAPLISLFYLENIPQKENIIDFAYNFGIAFQIKDDLLNIMNIDNTKPALSDIHNGIYTAPVLYLNEEIPITDLNESEIVKLVSSKKYIDKTANLIKEYASKAIKAIDFIPQNQFKQEIIEITEKLYKAGINE